MELSTTTITKGRRYIYDGWMAVAERKFEAADGGTTTLEVGASKLERIYVSGANIDEWLYAAIDFNSDGDIGDDLNSTECSWSGGVAGKDTADAAFYFMTNRMGSTAALLDKNSDRKILEYYRYRSYGEVTVLTVLDDGTSPGTASDGIEDTPSDLGDNPSRRISKFANALTFTGHRLDDATGVMYYRHRMYDPVSGRFVSRDPLDYSETLSLYSYVQAKPTRRIDPTGLKSTSKANVDDLPGLFKWLYDHVTFSNTFTNPACPQHVTLSASLAFNTPPLKYPIGFGLFLDLTFGVEASLNREVCGVSKCKGGNTISVLFNATLSVSVGIPHVVEFEGSASLALGLALDLCEGKVSVTMFSATLAGTVRLGVGFFAYDWRLSHTFPDLLGMLGMNRNGPNTYPALKFFDCIDCSKCCAENNPCVSLTRAVPSAEVVGVSR